jgi:hypothetical protein
VAPETGFEGIGYLFSTHVFEADFWSAEKATELTPHGIETEMLLISDKRFSLARELEPSLMQMHWTTVMVRSWKG